MPPPQPGCALLLLLLWVLSLLVNSVHVPHDPKPVDVRRMSIHGASHSKNPGQARTLNARRV